MKKVLFLSHNSHPHESHLEMAKVIDARIKITPFNVFVEKINKYPILGIFYIPLCFFYGLFLKCNEKIILVNGGSSVWIALGLKIKRPSLKIVYLDGDPFIKFPSFSRNIFLKFVDKIISVSEQNKEIAEKYFKGSIEVIHPFPKKVKYIKTERKNYGLYVGRLSQKDKNIKRIISFALQCPYLERMIIVGDGVFRNYVEKIAKKNPKLIYVGKVKDPSFYYSQCKFLIHLANFDSFPTATMEAVLCDCFPIISKDVGTKILFDKIFIIEDPENFEEINKRIKYILENEKEMRKKLEKIRNKISDKIQFKKSYKFLKMEIYKDFF